jgi:hypothetical protein
MSTVYKPANTALSLIPAFTTSTRKAP